MEAPRHVLVTPPIDAVATLKALMEAAAARGTQPGPAEAGAVTPAAVTPPAQPQDDGLAGLLACYASEQAQPLPPPPPKLAPRVVEPWPEPGLDASTPTKMILPRGILRK